MIVPASPPAAQAARDSELASVEVSVVLPTYDEAENIAAVITAIQQVLEGNSSYEILVVDDNSPDETWRLADEISKRDPRVRCIRRIEERGLASAIFEGLGAARGERRVVMDADLQHDPELIPQLVAALDDADITVASRYLPGGSTSDWSASRLRVSRVATWLGCQAAGLSVTDPMSGFFAVRRETYEGVADKLRPRGFKALLELLCKARSGRVVEVPYRFRSRAKGESKLGNEVIFDYLLSLVELFGYRFFSSPFARYCIVGASGVLVQLAVLAVLQRVIDSRIALGVAILVAMVSNFVLNNAWTFREQKLERSEFGRGLVQFIAVCSVGAVVNYATTFAFHRLTGVTLVWSSLVGIALATIWNYKVNRLGTWGPRQQKTKGQG